MPMNAEEKGALVRVASGLPVGAPERRIILTTLRLAGRGINEATFKSIVTAWRDEVVTHLPAKVSIFNDDGDSVVVRFEIGAGLQSTSDLYRGAIEALFTLLDDGSVKIAADIFLPKLTRSALIDLRNSMKNPVQSGGFVSSDVKQLLAMSSVWIKDVQDALTPYDKITPGSQGDVLAVLLRGVRATADKHLDVRVLKEVNLDLGEKARIIFLVPYRNVKMTVYLEHKSDESLTVECSVMRLSRSQVDMISRSNLFSHIIKDLEDIVKFKPYTVKNFDIDTKHLDDVMDVVEDWFKLVKKTIGA